MRLTGELSSEGAAVHEDTFVLTIKSSAPPGWVDLVVRRGVDAMAEMLEPERLEDYSIRVDRVTGNVAHIDYQRDDADPGESVFRMGDLVQLLRDRSLGADVEQTGGGVATIYAYEDGIDAATTPDHPYVSIGPGTYNWPEPHKSEATLYELSATQRPEGYDSEGESVMFDETQTLEEVADEIVRLVRGMGQ